MQQLARFKTLLHRRLVESGYSTEWYLIPLAALVGATMGLVAVGFDWLVESAGYFFFGVLGQKTLDQTLPGGKLLLLIMLPALGGLAVGLIGLVAYRLAPRSKGHGIPVVVEALSRNEGHIPGRAGFFRAITSSLTIGSGGSAGVEGPIILIGSSFASTLARLARVGREHRQTLVGCGAAAATAGLFNAPIAGVIFVLEVILRDFSLKTFMPIVVASVFGTATAQALLGQNQAVFGVSEALSTGSVFSVTELGHYAVLGVLCGMMGATFNVAVRASERLGQKMAGPAWLKPALGGALLGMLGVGFVLLFRQPVVGGYAPPTFFGNGYPVITALLDPNSYIAETSDTQGQFRNAGLALLAALLGLKLVGTCLTIGSGGSGGIIAPSLLMGATLGGGFAVACRNVGLFWGETPASYALAGMAGVIAAVAHCPLTAFLLVFEITADYQVILPVMLVSILATTVAQLALPDSVFAAILRSRGIRTGTYSDLTLLRRMHCRDVPLTRAVTVHPEDPAQRLIDLATDYAVVDYVVTDEQGHCMGMVVGQDVRATLVQREAVPLLIVSELMRTDLPTVEPNQTLDVVMELFSQHDVAGLPVVDNDRNIHGMITRARLMQCYHAALEKRG